MGAAVLGALAVLAWRLHESRRAVSLKSLVIPPLGMSTGFSMFAVPAFRIPWTWGVGAFVLGAAVFAYPLVASPQLTRDGDRVMMRRP
jgi:membrane protein CcdC involved in cytochrome C biogenesis